MKNQMSKMPKMAIKSTPKPVLKAAKQGAKANVKADFKFKVADTKLAKSMGKMSSKEAKNAIGGAKKVMKGAKKEIKKYTDY